MGTILAVAIGSILIVAALSKLFRIRDTAEMWSHHEILPRRIVPVAVTAISIIELGLGVAILLPPTAHLGKSGAALLFVLFSAYLFRIAKHGSHVGCGCFGFDRGNINLAHVGRALILACASALSLPLGNPTPSGLIVFTGLSLAATFVMSTSVLAEMLARERQTQVAH